MLFTRPPNLVVYGATMTFARFVACRLMPCVLGLFLVAAAGSLFAEDAPDAPNGHTPPNTILRKTDLVDINASWPVVGIARVDEESEAFVKTQVDAFVKNTEELAEDLKTLAAEEGNRESAFPNLFPYELAVNNEVTYPSTRVVSILWNVWSFTGGAHGLLDIMANNYDRSTGFPVLLEDLFVDPQLAVLQFSKAARRQLAEKDDAAEDGAGLPDEMLLAGTEPVEENFKTFIVTPNGIRIHFQPYQVAPWAAGPQSVDVSLDELKTAKPRLEFWDKQTPAS